MNTPWAFSYTILSESLGTFCLNLALKPNLQLQVERYSYTLSGNKGSCDVCDIKLFL